MTRSISSIAISGLVRYSCKGAGRHHIAGPYLNAFAYETASREDHRRVANGEQAMLVAGVAWRPASAASGRVTGSGINLGREIKIEFTVLIVCWPVALASLAYGCIFP